MDDGLKQRLIGAIVLLAVAVIFLPVLFDRERIEPLDETTQIPIAPEVPSVAIEEPTPLPVEEEAKVAVEMFTPDESQAVSLEQEPTGVDNNGVPKSWVLQVASYRIDGHAKEMRDKLIAEGYSAYTKEINAQSGKMTRLYVGPKFEKKVLIKDKAAIDKKYKVTTMLLKFEP